MKPELSGVRLRSLAESFGLKLEFKNSFHEIFAENHEVPAFADLLKRMKVVDENGESHMDPDQWEAASTSSFSSSYV